MRLPACFLSFVLLLGITGCSTSTLRWRPAAEGTRSSAGNPVLWHLQGANSGLYLFYYIPIVSGDSGDPNRFDYSFFCHEVNEKHAEILMNSRLRQLKADAVEDLSVRFSSNGWIGLGIVWNRSFSARGEAVKKIKK